MAVALAAIVGFVIYHEVSSSGSPPSHNSPAASAAGVSHSSHPGVTPTAGSTNHRPHATPAAAPYANEVVINLKAIQNCWVELTTASGKQVYAGVVVAGASMHWTEQQAVTLRLGNPGGVALTVNGKNKVAGTNNQPVTLSLGPGANTPS